MILKLLFQVQKILASKFEETNHQDQTEIDLLLCHNDTWQMMQLWELPYDSLANSTSQKGKYDESQSESEDAISTSSFAMLSAGDSLMKKSASAEMNTNGITRRRLVKSASAQSLGEASLANTIVWK